MAKTSKSLAQFRIEGSGEKFQLHIEDDAGETVEFEVNREQLDVIVEHLEDILAEDDA